MSVLQKYTFLKVLGDGTFGVVSLAKEKETGNMVAIKKMKQDFLSWEECLKLKEVQALQRLKHVNIIKATEIFRDNNTLYFVFEYMRQNLYELIKSRGSNLFPEHVVRNISYQIIQAVSYMHSQGLFHRDLKPENILCQGHELIKLADFGQAREIRSRPPYTDYVSTRWYRAPEVQLGSKNYNSPIDIWAVACIMSEVYSGRPLFPGSGTIDQVYKICGVLGTPTKATWGEGVGLAVSMSIRLPIMVPTPLSALVPTASDDGVSVMKEMLQWNPRRRPTAKQVLMHKYFQVGHPYQTPSQVTSTAGHSTKNTLTNTPNRDKERENERGGRWQEDKEGKRANQYLGGGAGPYDRNSSGSKKLEQAKTEKGGLPEILKKSAGSYNNSPLFGSHNINGGTNHQRKQWQTRSTAESGDSGVDSEGAQLSNHFNSYPKYKGPPLKPPAPVITSLVPPSKPSAVPLISSLFGGQKRAVKRKDTLPTIDSFVGGDGESRRGQFVAKETTGGRRDEGPDKFPFSWKSKASPGVVDKREATNFYLTRARYSPIVSGKVGFGSGAPRFNGPTPSPKHSGTIREPNGRNLLSYGQYGEGGRGRQWNGGGEARAGGVGGFFGSRTRGVESVTTTTAAASNNQRGGRGGGGGSILPNLGLLARVDWSSRYKR